MTLRLIVFYSIYVQEQETGEVICCQLFMTREKGRQVFHLVDVYVCECFLMNGVRDEEKRTHNHNVESPHNNSHIACVFCSLGLITTVAKLCKMRK